MAYYMSLPFITHWISSLSSVLQFFYDPNRMDMQWMMVMGDIHKNSSLWSCGNHSLPSISIGGQSNNRRISGGRGKVNCHSTFTRILGSKILASLEGHETDSYDYQGRSVGGWGR